MLEQSENKDTDFINFWTMKEAISKYEGMGLSLPFVDIDVKKYSICSKIISDKHLALSVCLGDVLNEYNSCDEIDEVINMCSLL